MIRSDLSEPLMFDHAMSLNVSYGHYYYTFPNHWHDFMEIIAPLNDEYTLSLGTETWQMNRDQIALIAPRTLHSIAQKTDKPNLILQFSNIFLPQLHDFAANRQVFLSDPILDIHDGVPFEENPLELLLRIKDVFYGREAFRELRMYELLLRFFIVVGKHNTILQSELSALKTPQQKAYDQKFEAISKFLRERYMNDVSMEDTAAFAGFSKYHFSRLFKEYYQMSFPEYVTSLRIAKAKELLENPAVSIMDVALQSGFSSIASFNRAFKRQNQCTPSQFRKMFGQSTISWGRAEKKGRLK